MIKPMFEIFKEVKKAKSLKKKVEVLRQNDSPTLREFCAYCVNPHINFLLPEGNPPFDKLEGDEAIDCEEVLHANVSKLYLYVEGGNPNLNQIKREGLFIDLLETIHPEDAELLLRLKDKKVKELSEKLVNEAYPGFLSY